MSDFDFDRAEWLENKKKNWPEGSLKRFLMLNYPECRTASEALKKAIADLAELKELKQKIKDSEK